MKIYYLTSVFIGFMTLFSCNNAIETVEPKPNNILKNYSTDFYDSELMREQCTYGIEINPQYIGSRKKNCMGGFGFRCGPVVIITVECVQEFPGALNSNFDINTDMLYGYINENQNSLLMSFPNINKQDLGISQNEKFQLAKGDVFAGILDGKGFQFKYGEYEVIENQDGLFIEIPTL